MIRLSSRKHQCPYGFRHYELDCEWAPILDARISMTGRFELPEPDVATASFSVMARRVNAASVTHVRRTIRGVGESGADSVGGLFSKTLELRYIVVIYKICLFLHGKVWYYQYHNITLIIFDTM